ERGLAFPRNGFPGRGEQRPGADAVRWPRSREPEALAGVRPGPRVGRGASRPVGPRGMARAAGSPGAVPVLADAVRGRGHGVGRGKAAVAEEELTPAPGLPPCRVGSGPGCVSRKVRNSANTPTRMYTRHGAVRHEPEAPARERRSRAGAS